MILWDWDLVGDVKVDEEEILGLSCIEWWRVERVVLWYREDKFVLIKLCVLVVSFKIFEFCRLCFILERRDLSILCLFLDVGIFVWEYNFVSGYIV